MDREPVRVRNSHRPPIYLHAYPNTAATSHLISIYSSMGATATRHPHIEPQELVCWNIADSVRSEVKAENGWRISLSAFLVQCAEDCRPIPKPSNHHQRFLGYLKGRFSTSHTVADLDQDIQRQPTDMAPKQQIPAYVLGVGLTKVCCSYLSTKRCTNRC